MPSPPAQLEINERYLDVPEIIRRFHLVIEVPEAWRLITIREAVLFISERELPRESDGSFSLTNGQRANGLLSAACGILQDSICKDAERPSFNCSTVFGCYLLEGLNACASGYWNKRNSRCSHRGKSRGIIWGGVAANWLVYSDKADRI
ncbi:hypothetical protein VE01_01396 [Pseudogymnoascus verrucosus]|uniref:Uncharacterized protein n=1 Tax=Pseudogymnoascus verrucosus TaxID=342668 RepID=A0A1B8GX28_9PEZI|nr:uncharacterized protein VE01_01396 [Pseudogymnoascus verrucosus]OBU00367.2 hypothetical protein VE01_01396 [Pseudogymnoascus verrucosus]